MQKKDTGEILAMKVMRKDKIMERNHGDYMKAERDILTKIVHPFIVTLRYSFQVWGYYNAAMPSTGCSQLLLLAFHAAVKYLESHRNCPLSRT